MNPALGILILALAVILWVLIVFVVYPFAIAPLIRIYRNEYRKAKRTIDETVDDIIGQEEEK